MANEGDRPDPSVGRRAAKKKKKKSKMSMSIETPAPRKVLARAAPLATPLHWREAT
jgi:hypothetical protein